MNKRTALEIASRLEALIPIAGGLAAEALRQQHAEIERLKTVPMKYRRMAFNAQLQEENAQLSEKIERLTAIIAKDGYAELWAECYTLRCEIKGPDGFETWKDAAVHERREMFKVKAEAKRLTKERDAAIAAAVAAERDACAAVCENGNFLHDAAPTAIFGKECARAIRARSAT